MQTTELRQGNKIMWGDTVQTVAAILTDNYIQCDPLEADRTINEFEPIPLTAELLKKAGFSKYKTIEDGHSKWAGKFQLHFTEWDNTAYFHSQVVPSPPIKYLHQLQNLYFSLTGEELVIKSTAVTSIPA